MTMEVAGWRDLDLGQEAVSLSSLPTLAGGSRTISECVRTLPRPTRLYEAGPALLFLYGRRSRSFKGVLVCLNSSTDGGASPHLKVLELTPFAIGVGEATMGLFEGSHEAWDQFLVAGGGSLAGRCPDLGCRGVAGTDLTLISRPCAGIRHSVLEGRGDVQMSVSFLPRFTTIGTLQTAPAWVLGTSPEDGAPDTVEPWDGDDSALTTDEPAANARRVRRRSSMTTQENGVTDIYKGDVSYVPLAWLRCSPVASDWIAGSILCGLQSKRGRLIMVVYTSTATAWVWFEGERRESSVVMAASTFLLGSLFLWNYQAVARAISPFGNTRDQLITLILASLSFFYSILAGLYHPRGMLGGEVWWPTIAMVLLVCLLSVTARECRRRDRRVDAKSWISLCRRGAVDFQEVGCLFARC
ncbi:unnamed protein product [Ectocarpus sp. CCAP 1310/34]|nr:unnamed protein product [Ectocarpus sp. CCAP 1310/34]